MAKKREKRPCVCSDVCCRAHEGVANCNAEATTLLFRVDMEDETGLELCEACEDDALESGLFRDADLGERVAAGF